LREAKKQTSGVMASSIIHSLCDPVFLHACNEKRREASENLEKHAISKKGKWYEEDSMSQDVA
jgi:hypothetical protein